jgi:hypothetical protein
VTLAIDESKSQELEAEVHAVECVAAACDNPEFNTGLRYALRIKKEGIAMSHNAKALLLAGSLILASGVGVIYLSAERAATAKEATMTSDESVTTMIKRADTRPSTSVYGLPAHVTPVSIRIRE